MLDQIRKLHPKNASAAPIEPVSPGPAEPLDLAGPSDRIEKAKVPSVQPDGSSVMSLAVKPLLSRIGELAAVSLAINLLSLAVPIFVLQVYDRVVFHGGLATLAGLAIGVTVALVFDFVLRQSRSRLIQMVALRVDVGVIRVLFDRLSNISLRRMESQSDADWHGLLRDQETVRDTLAGPATVLLVDLPFVLVFIGVIWIVAQPIAWLLIAMVPIYVAVAALSSAMIGRASDAEQEGAADRHFLSAQLVTGRITAKTLGLGHALKGRWEAAQAQLIKRSLRRGSTVDAFNNLSAEMAMLTTVVMTSVGAVAIVAGELTIGGLIAANMLATRVVQPLVQLIGVWRVAARLREAAKRLDAMIDQPTDRQHSAVERDRPQGLVSVEGVDFRYIDDAEPALQGISAAFEPGAMHGIFGLNGAGKTTLLNVLQGLYVPDRGRVLLDGADIRQYGQEDLSRWIGFASQETYLYAGTIRDNISKLRSDVSDARILAAARQAGADEFIVDLPDGYDTQVGDGGRRFSAGQRQRIALARALIDNPPVVLLDEPNAHLDAKATSELITQLTRLSRDRTVIVVSHCRELLQSCQKVLVLSSGSIAASGAGPDMTMRLFATPLMGEAA